MPGSVRENDIDTIDFVNGNNIRTVLDVGAGRGTYGILLGPHVDRIDAVEVWPPYVEEFNLHEIYDSVIIGDIRTLPVPEYNYDLIVFGDVLEHMNQEESKNVWLKSEGFCRYGLISVPIIHYPQGAEFGNPHEVHVQEHLHPEDIKRDYGPFVFEREYKITGTYIRKF